MAARVLRLVLLLAVAPDTAPLPALLPLGCAVLVIGLGLLARRRL